MQNLSSASDEISFCKILTVIPFVKLQLIAHLTCVNTAKHGSVSVSVRERGWQGGSPIKKRTEPSQGGRVGDSLLDNVVLSAKAATQRSVCPHARAGGHEATR